ncbi:MAG: phosphate ABC transporter permease subunit PstC [Chloroflexi bacterium]|nr:phosphate ABC transporter permease subunit PstC [Chloroflexota bacterium]
MSIISKRKTFGSASRIPREWIRRTRHGDVIFRGLTIASACIVLLAFVAIGLVLWQSSPLPREKFGLDFLASTEWDPVQQNFGALPFIYGTLVTSVFALIMAVPVALGIAIFLAELAPEWLRQPVSYLIELLAAVPSVIFGLWGLYVLIPVLVRPTAEFLTGNLGFLPLFSGPIFGPSRLAASVVLTIMILPTISALCRDVFLAIPNSQREAALALGATKWEMISQVLIPYGMSGILGGVILGLGRALGETIAVTMVIGNNRDLTASILHPGYTMASIIANEFAEATDEMYRQALIQIGLILFAITLILNLIARLLVWRVARRMPTEVRA